MIEIRQNSRRFITGVKYVFVEDIASESKSSGIVSCTLKSGKQWNDVYFTKGSATLKDDSMVGIAGKKYSYQFEVNIPGGMSEFNLEIDRICSRPVVVLLEYNDGEVIYCGGVDKKLRLERKRNTGVVTSSVVVFEYESREAFGNLAI